MLKEKLKDNHSTYYRKHISVKPEIYKEFIKEKAEIMLKDGLNVSDSEMIRILLFAYQKNK